MTTTGQENKEAPTTERCDHCGRILVPGDQWRNLGGWKRKQLKETHASRGSSINGRIYCSHDYRERLRALNFDDEIPYTGAWIKRGLIHIPTHPTRTRQ